MIRLPLPVQLGALYACSVQGTQKEQSAAAHELLRSALPEYAQEHGIALPDVLSLSETPSGKPFLPDCPAMHFNLSHCRGLAVCLLAPSECGVDVEAVRPVREKVLKRAFSRAERTAIAAAEGKDLLFTRLWTLKEAYVKAIGTGIGYPMKEVSFTLQGGAIRCSKSGADFRQMLYEGFSVSVCVLR